MTAPLPTTVEDAEAAWLKALLTPGVELLRALLHPEFVAIHSPVGVMHDRDQFVADTANRPTPEDVRVVAPTIRHFPEMATVSCVQEMWVPFVPGLPAFVFQAACSRVWVREDGHWQLAHLVMYRRLPPS